MTSGEEFPFHKQSMKPDFPQWFLKREPEVAELVA